MLSFRVCGAVSGRPSRKEARVTAGEERALARLEVALTNLAVVVSQLDGLLGDFDETPREIAP
jgi:hypothetical protein